MNPARKPMALESRNPSSTGGSLEKRAYLFVADGMSLGGIETLLVRMANQNARLGYRVFVASVEGHCTRDLRDVTQLNIQHSSEIIPSITSTLRKELPDKCKLFIWAATPSMLFQLHRVQRCLFQEKKIESVCVSGIFGPVRAVESISELFRLAAHLITIHWLPRGCIYFMSNAVKQTYLSKFGSSFSSWPTHNLVLEKPQVLWQPTCGLALRVISVGRIAKLKSYNFGALDVVESLIKSGISVHWDIWGHGDEAEMLQAAIESRGLASNVIFHGPLQYSKFGETVSRADLFVGMGTAALEAAQMGVPTIVTLAWSRASTYGFLYDCPADSIGEYCSGAEEKDLTGMVKSFSKLSFEERRTIGLRCQEAVYVKTSGEGAPFDRIFVSGLKFPNGLTVLLRIMSYNFAKLIWSIGKRLFGLKSSY